MGGDKGGRRVQVNYEQVSLESFAEAGERLSGPDLMQGGSSIAAVQI